MRGFLHWLAELLRWLADRLDPADAPRSGQVVFHSEGETSMGMISVETGSADLSATVTFLDAQGNPATPDDVPSWTSDNEDAAVVVAAEDGLSGTVTIGSAGAAIISVDTTNTDGSTVHSQGTITVLPDTDVATGDVQFEAPA